MSDTTYGVKVLPQMYDAWSKSGMIASIGARMVDVGPGTLTLEADMSPDRHGFPTGRGLVVHGGAIATLVDEALATVAFTLAEGARPRPRPACRSTTTAPPRPAAWWRGPESDIAPSGWRTATPPWSRRTARSSPRPAP